MADSLKDMMLESWNYKMTSVLAKAIEFKFPDIKGLEIVPKDDHHFSIIFEDDGIHTQSMIDAFLEELRTGF